MGQREMNKLKITLVAILGFLFIRYGKYIIVIIQIIVGLIAMKFLGMV